MDIIECGDLFGKLVFNFNGLFSIFTGSNVLGVSLYDILIGVAFGTYIAWVVAKWIIDIAP